MGVIYWPDTYSLCQTSNWNRGLRQAGHCDSSSWCWVCTESDFLITSNWAADRSLCFFCYRSITCTPVRAELLTVWRASWRLTFNYKSRRESVEPDVFTSLYHFHFIFSFCLPEVLCLLLSLPSTFVWLKLHKKWQVLVGIHEVTRDFLMITWC